MANYFLLIITVLIGAVGQTLLKLGVNQSTPHIQGISSFQNILHAIFVYLTNYFILLSLAIYSVGFFLWLTVLSKFQLSFAFPVITATTFLLIMLCSWLFLHENITPLRVAGTLLISIGIFLIFLSKN